MHIRSIPILLKIVVWWGHLWTIQYQDINLTPIVNGNDLMPREIKGEMAKILEILDRGQQNKRTKK